MTTANVSSPSLLASLVLTADVAALLERSYGKGSPILDKSAVKPAKPSKLAAMKRGKGEKSEKKSTDLVWVIPAPKVQDHERFLCAMREAGIRRQDRVNPVTGEVVTVDVFDDRQHRLDAQYFVALYAGWTNEPWGTQIDRATQHARFALLPQTEIALPHRSPEAHSARWSADGWTKGAPDAFDKIRMDLEARERLAVSEVSHMSALYEMAGKDLAGFERRLLQLAKEDPSLAAMIRQRPDLLRTMCALAEERLATVREDLETFDFSDPVAVERRYATLNMRGLPTFAEAIALLDTTPRA